MKEYQSMTSRSCRKNTRRFWHSIRAIRQRAETGYVPRETLCRAVGAFQRAAQPESVHWGKWRGFRNYGLLARYAPGPPFFAELMGVEENEVIVGGNSSLTLMYYMIDLGWRVGFADSDHPWRTEEKLKFLCPVPGYDRHFAITEYFGFEMLPIPMKEDGPDMDLVEQLAADPSVKGIWCVPLYSIRMAIFTARKRYAGLPA